MEGRNQWISNPENLFGKHLEVVIGPPKRHAPVLSLGPQNVASFETLITSLLTALAKGGWWTSTSMTDALRGDADVGEEAMELDGYRDGGNPRPRDTKAY